MKDASREHGYTLIEMVSVISILSIIGLVSSSAALAAMRVYTRVAPALDAGYQAELASARMKREIHGLRDAGSITAFTPTALTFVDLLGNTIAYRLAGTDLLRNGELLAQGVTALNFGYWRSDGTPAPSAASLRLIELDLTTRVGGQTCRSQTTVLPRALGP